MITQQKQETNNLKKRIKNLSILVKDAINLGFSTSLIGNFESQLNELKNQRDNEILQISKWKI